MRVRLALGLLFVWAPGAWGGPDLQSLIDAAPAGQRLVVPAGRHEGPFVIRRPITLVGHSGAVLVRAPGSRGPTLWVTSSDVVLEGLEIRGTGEGTRRDHTALVATGSRITLRDLVIVEAWAGLWLDGCDQSSVQGLRFRGLRDFPFWERGDGVRVTQGHGILLQGLDLEGVADGVYGEQTTDLRLDQGRVRDARYGVHLMFCQGGQVTGLETGATVAGAMIMESRDCSLADSMLVEGYRTGSAGVRAIRTLGLRVTNTLVARHATGIELVDSRDGRFRGNRIAQNAVAWSWGRDNSGTQAQDNTHQGNLQDFSGGAAGGTAVPGPHDHGGPGRVPTSVAAPTGLQVPPAFTGNYWDGWRGLDTDRDGRGDTPYRWDPASASHQARSPWSGIFLGSPWSQWSRGLPGGEVVDAHPRTRP